MGGKNRNKSKNAVIAQKKQTLSDGTEFEVAIYTPVLRGGKYISKIRMVINGDAEEACLDEDSSVDALSYALFCLRYEMNAKGIVGDRQHPTGLEFGHPDPDMNSLFENMNKLESSITLSYRETVSRGQYHGKHPNSGPVGPETVAGMDSSDELLERWSAVTQLRHIIRIRIIEMGVQKRFKGPLFELGRLPKVRHLAKGRNTCPPVATTTRLVKETKKNAHISIWAPAQASGKTLWRCEYQIDGLERRIVAETEGADSMDALTSVFDAIAEDLDNSSYSVAYPGENGEWDSTFANGDHGFERHGEPEMNALLTYLFTAEVLRNNILYKSAAGEECAAGLETEMLNHLSEAERIRVEIDRRLCSGGPLLLLRPEPG